MLKIHAGMQFNPDECQVVSTNTLYDCYSDNISPPQRPGDVISKRYKNATSTHKLSKLVNLRINNDTTNCQYRHSDHYHDRTMAVEQDFC